MPGTVIIINGPSASGKSSIQKSVQTLFDEPYLSVGIDRLFDQFFPDEHNGIKAQGKFTAKDLRWVETVEVEGKPSMKLFLGPVGESIAKGMHAAIGAYAKAGNNLIIDYILYSHEWIKDLKEALKGCKVYWIGIKYPLPVIEEREFSRSTSPVGHARSHYYDIHPFEYDMVLDDPSKSPEALALEIKEFVEKHPEPTAFNRIP